jgi:hypothetical protein
MVAYTHGGYYISDRIAIMRKDADQKPTHFFGNAEAEKSRYIPGELSTNTSLNFVAGMIEIAEYLSVFHKDKELYNDLMNDIDNYSFPVLSVQRDKPVADFVKYFLSLRFLGLGITPYFYLYFIVLLVFGRKNSYRLIILIKRVLGRTPTIGNLDQGKLVSPLKQ